MPRAHDPDGGVVLMQEVVKGTGRMMKEGKVKEGRMVDGC